jgi:hypothetical protein
MIDEESLELDSQTHSSQIPDELLGSPPSMEPMNTDLRRYDESLELNSPTHQSQTDDPHSMKTGLRRYDEFWK